MSEPKVHCRRCGVEILAATAQRTGGICMPCKNDPPPEWARRQRWINHGMDPLASTPWYRSPWADELLKTCRQIVGREIDCLKGSEQMVGLAGNVLDAAHGEKWLHPNWEAFFRCVWDADEVRTQEQNIAAQDAYSSRVLAAAQKLIEEANEKVMVNKDAEPSAPPNGGPATQHGNSGAMAEPPSVT